MRAAKKVSSGRIIDEDRVYFGIIGPGDTVPDVLYTEHKLAKAALLAINGSAKVGRRRYAIVRALVRIEIVGGGPRPRPRATH